MKDWKKEGVSWSLYLFLTLEILKPLIFEEEITLPLLIIMFPIYLFAGVLMTFVMRYFKKKMKN